MPTAMEPANLNQHNRSTNHSNTLYTNHNAKHLKTLTALIAAFGICAPSYAEDEVYLATLDNDKIVDVKNISNREGYDNQPHFSPDSKGLLFSSMFKGSSDTADNQQTDSMHYQLSTGKLTNLSQSTASEYSPTITPDGKHFSMIRVGDDGKQLLWQYPFAPVQEINTTNRTSLIPEIYDVGYHVWLNSDELLLFMLGEPMTLQRVNLQTGKLSLVDNNIGRTLRKVPNKSRYSYVKEVNKRWLVKLYDPQSKGVQNSVLLPGQNMYYAWHRDGRLLTAEKNVVKSINVDVYGDKWQTYLDLSKSCTDEITRMVMSDNSKYFAFVCQTEDAVKP